VPVHAPWGPRAWGVHGPGPEPHLAVRSPAPMYFDYLNVLVFASVGLVFVFANLLVAQLVRPTRTGDEGLETYECGEETIGDAWVSFDIRYYTVALVYVVFAVEIAFLFPWALVLREAFAGTGAAAGKGIGLFALVEGVLFVVILFLGLVYVWVKGDLDWVLSYSGEAWRPKERAPRAVRNVYEIEAEREAAAEAAKVAETGGGADEAEAVPAPEPTA
jgi:NADH-quinone oxidoreductase subunit A